MMRTVINFMDNRMEEIAVPHMIRPDGDCGVYRVTYDNKEATIPMCNVRSVEMFRDGN